MKGIICCSSQLAHSLSPSLSLILQITTYFYNNLLSRTITGIVIMIVIMVRDFQIPPIHRQEAIIINKS